MEEFARLVVNTGGLECIASVHDQFVEFACLENRLFTLNVKESYVLYNNPGATGDDMERAMNGIAGGLFSVVATLGSVPVIRCPRVSLVLQCRCVFCVLVGRITIGCIYVLFLVVLDDVMMVATIHLV